MACKDCIKEDVCRYNDGVNLWCKGNAGFGCPKFKDKNSFVELPCKVGDTFYTCGYECIIDYECLGFQYGFYNGNKNALMLIAVYGQEFVLGEEAFLTKEEAEQALKEREKE